ncbi:oxidoreductase, partial [Burkholderia multivorans]
TNPVAVTTAEELAANPIPADLVLIAVKASGLDQVIDDIRPAIGPDTLIIPFLNGMAHIDRLDREFPGQVLGGLVK